MVNVGGRSRGCSTCRKRRVKCDESHPICRRCQTLNLECHGARGISFIYHEPAGPIKTDTRTRTTPTALSEEAPVLQLSATPRTVGFDVYIRYTQAHLQRNGLIESTLTDIKAADLAPPGTPVASRQVSHQAIMSFATILFGIQHRQADITTQGYAMHSVALKQVHQVLSDTGRQCSDQVVVAVAVLSISELLVPSGPKSYLPHVMGLQKLMHLQDPVSFWSEKPSGFCKGVRFMILLASLKVGEPSILARPDWKTAMRTSSCSYQELQEQDLFDVLADCTVLLAEGDAIMSSARNTNSINPAGEQRDDMARRASCLLNYLYEWRRRWETDLENNIHCPETDVSPSRQEEPRSIGNDESPEVAPWAAATALIPNIPAAIMLMLYNLALMRVLQITATLPQQQLETVHECRANQRMAAREACRCIQYYLGTRRCVLDASASPIIHWAVATVWTALCRDDSIEGAWMRDLLSRKRRQVLAGGIWTTYLWLNSLPE
ncbi:hypothetical protein QBC37DRAFT_393521 [Rhypophila decipiens]|uniref:Zn(2)-C6 fungal-type domain-containing protein n=1 Tax=Rhypophila decipiens TaxID=261697 RepID=A0AAN7B0F4_9PEZI|nr:hypothetical protein QBC37DRAFT_393521 [Rhypophila decipiens]